MRLRNAASTAHGWIGGAGDVDVLNGGGAGLQGGRRSRLTGHKGGGEGDVAFCLEVHAATM